jgi:hypothetical protein
MVRAEDEHDEDQKMRQSFGVLRAIDGADAERKESSEDAGDCGIGAGAGQRPRGSSHRIHRLRRHESRDRGSAFYPGCEARLAVYDAANVAGAAAAEWLATGAAESHCGNVVMS